MFLWVSSSHVGAHPDELQHGVSIEVSINLVKKFLQVSCLRKIYCDLNLGLKSLHIYLPSFPPDSGLNLLNAFNF